MPKALSAYRPFWAKRFGPAPFLPMSRAEMDALGWDSCDIVIVTGDAYVDHPSFGMAVIGRVLEAQGFRVGIIAQPDWHSAGAVQGAGQAEPVLRRHRRQHGFDDQPLHRRPQDRAATTPTRPATSAASGPTAPSLVYAQRCREAFNEVPIVLGGIEGSLRRIAHYDYWQDKVRRSILVDAKGDLLLYGNAERAIVEIAHRLARREPVQQITDVRGTAFMRRTGDPSADGWFEIDSTDVDQPGRIDEHINPYQNTVEQAASQGASCAKEEGAAPGVADQPITFFSNGAPKLIGRYKLPPRERTVIRLPAYEQVKSDPVLYAHASRVLHLETNPGNARALVQRHADRDVWLNPPPIPLSTAEMDWVFDLPYARCTAPGLCRRDTAATTARPRSRPGR